MPPLTNSLGNRLCKRAGWAPGMAPEASRAARRALLMAGFWTILIFVAFRWLALSGQGFNTGLAIAHLSASAIGGGLIQELVEIGGGE